MSQCNAAMGLALSLAFPLAGNSLAIALLLDGLVLPRLKDRRVFIPGRGRAGCDTVR